MGKYLFFPSADKRQDEIWDYTSERWGEKQAEKYIRGLHRHLQKTADRKTPWRALPSHLFPGQEVYFTRYEKHCIFFKKLPRGTIGIMSILHEAMDMPVRLAEDLRFLEENPSS